jgi:uncharacterized membrane protein YfcA
MSILELVIVLVGGFFAGVVNTFAGNGSAITLSILTEVLGLAPNLANGTNRVGILFQSVTGVLKFKEKGFLDIGKSKWIVLTMIFGAIIGVITAVNVSNHQFKFVFNIMMVVMLVVILVKPSRWISPVPNKKEISPFIMYPLFLIMGFYGGFIQMGMGIFFLALMVLVAKYDLISANSVKLVIVSLFTLIIIPIFHYKGLIDWKIGMIMAIGQSLGAFVSVNYAAKWDNANVWAYRILVAIVVLVVLKVFGVFGLIFG